jgi:hypothetical protein
MICGLHRGMIVQNLFEIRQQARERKHMRLLNK